MPNIANNKSLLIVIVVLKNLRKETKKRKEKETIITAVSVNSKISYITSHRLLSFACNNYLCENVPMNSSLVPFILEETLLLLLFILYHLIELIL